MNAYVTDTHALLWHLSRDAALSSKAAGIFAQADAGQAEIVVPAICLVEIVYLCERERVPADRVQKVLHLMQLRESKYRFYPLDVPVVAALQQIDRASVPDMPDRIIAATALHLALPLITRDGKLNACQMLECMW